jgi:DNA polymerase-3 subunit epsilon
MRQVIVDTETTGLDPREGHRIIEIGCVELIHRRHTSRHFHQYFRPDRDIDEGALQVHGISNEFLADKPAFTDAAEDLIGFLNGAELVIHNAPFDVGFINHELSLAGRSYGRIEDYCGIVDTLALARELHPGQKNSLDALCKRYDVDNSQRELHGALLDAQILAEVYLAMTGGQATLDLASKPAGPRPQVVSSVSPGAARRTPVVRASAEERAAHERLLDRIEAQRGAPCVWREAEERQDGPLTRAGG